MGRAPDGLRAPCGPAAVDEGGLRWTTNWALIRANPTSSTIHRTYNDNEKKKCILLKSRAATCREEHGEVPMRAGHPRRGREHRTTGGRVAHRRAPGVVGPPGHAERQ